MQRRPSRMQYLLWLRGVTRRNVRRKGVRRQSDEVQNLTKLTRRSLIRAGLTASAGTFAAACSPARSLAPGRPTQSGAVPWSATPQPTPRASEHIPPSPVALKTQTPRPTEPGWTSTQVSESRKAVRSVGSLGRAYRAYPEVSGTVQFANCWDGPSIPLVEGWIADMSAIYPSIKVESMLADAASMREQLVTALAGGAPPNAIMLNSDSIAFFAEQGALLPLDGLLARDGISSDWFQPSELASRTWDGHIFGLPQTIGGAQHLLFVNVALLDKIGVDPARPIRTWQDLDALIEPARRAGLLVMDPTRVAVETTAHQVWTYANGGRYCDDELKKISWSEPAGVQSAEWLLRFVKAQAGSYERLASDGDPRTPLSAREWADARYVCCTNGAGWPFQLQMPGHRTNYAIYEFPTNGENPRSIGETPTTGGWTVVIPKAARDQEAAWEWLKLTTVSDSACAFTERQRRPSPLAGYDDRSGLRAAHPFWATIGASIAKSVPVPIAPIQPRLEQIYRSMQAAILLERRSSNDALESAARDAQQLLDNWNAKRRRT
jgi:multiple sugar transport system substrate-binding protein